jgi:hypothetical protein
MLVKQKSKMKLKSER